MGTLHHLPHPVWDHPFPHVTRVEVIGPHGRELIQLDTTGVAIDLQDNGRTLKLFHGRPTTTAANTA